MRELIVGPDLVNTPYPVMLKATVVKGFGRGSKELGIPTANLSGEIVEEKCSSMDTGIYFGWCSISSSDERFPMVMSLGWNPYYKNEKKSAEVHVIHEFEEDFYGAELRVLVLGYIRPEKDYDTLDDLIADIKWDIKAALESLKRVSYLKYREDLFLKPCIKS